MSSETRRSRTASAKASWSSSEVPSRSSSSPAFVSIVSRQSSTILRALFGGAAPVSRSRTISATASSIGASDCSVMSSKLARWYLSSSIAARLARDAVHAARADRLAARLLDGVEDRARLPAFRREAAVHLAVVAGEAERHRIAETARDGGFRGVSRRGGSGSRTLPGASIGRSAA